MVSYYHLPVVAAQSLQHRPPRQLQMRLEPPVRGGLRKRMSYAADSLFFILEGVYGSASQRGLSEGSWEVIPFGRTAI